jgi:putative ABC transport system permease protein
MHFILRMAWRDSRASRRRLALFSLSIVLGIAALVAIGSLGDNLQRAIDRQAKALLGADLVVYSRSALPAETEAFLEGLGGEQARELNFTSMLALPAREAEGVAATRLVQVRGMAGEFPFYGDFETVPAEARARFRAGEGVIVEESVLVQFELEPGDRVRLGQAEFEVLGALRKIAGESPAFGMLAPRVLVPLARIGETELVQPGSLVRYRHYFAFAEGADVEALVRGLRDRLREQRLGFDTVEQRKRDLGRTLGNINSFLRLVGFVALLLGGIGVASAIHVYVRGKLATVAVLRCLGARAWTAFAVYLVQGLALGVLGAVVGAALGVAVQRALPALVAGMLPFEVEFGVSWPAVAKGMAAGVVIGLLFTLPPLLAVRRVSPLQAIRADFEGQRPKRDPLAVATWAAIVGAVVLLALAQSTRWQMGLGFAAGIGVAFAALAGVAKSLTWAARRWMPRRLPFVWRQGLANLHRPNNRTVLLLLALGLGTFLVVTLALTRGTLLAQFEGAGSGDRPNLALFDIQDDQREDIEALLAEIGTPVAQQAPVVTMRLAALKGKRVEEWLREPGTGIPAWTLRREYRATYRGGLVATERLVAGQWTPRVEPGVEPVPISLEEGIARDLQLGLGDELEFDVQGVPVRTVVGSLRSVDWQRLQPNFFVVFPEGVLEPAPKFHMMVTRAATPQLSAEIQRRVVQRHPNVSALDLALLIETVDSIVSRVAYVVRIMALFTVVTGVIVLAGAVLTGRFQRIRETVLLRTLGASRQQVQRIMIVEYTVLGLLAATTGIVLAAAANWALAFFVFETTPAAPGWETLATAATVVAVTLVTGLLSNRGVCEHPPLQVLRQET